MDTLWLARSYNPSDTWGIEWALKVRCWDANPDEYYVQPFKSYEAAVQYMKDYTVYECILIRREIGPWKSV